MKTAPSIMGTAEVAAYLGWDRRKVAVYHGRGLLPAPVAELACGPLWDRADIERWMSTQRDTAVQEAWSRIRDWSVEEIQAQHAMLQIRRVTASAESEGLVSDTAQLLVERFQGAQKAFPGRRYRMVVSLVPEGRWADADHHSGAGEPPLRAEGGPA